MKVVSVLDTSISDTNLGNQIIMDSVNNIMHEIFANDFVFRLQYAERFGTQSINYINMSDYTIFGGTNSLSSRMNRYKQMGFSLYDIFIISNITLLGVGWWQYEKQPNLYTKIFLKKLLSKNSIHSVRDSYTERMLSSIGINNVINTSCPTTWNLTREHCSKITIYKSDDVITTLTDYNKSRELDETLINLLLNNYNKVYFWIQGLGDWEYISSLKLCNFNRIIPVSPNLKSYDTVLSTKSLDYIGTRLHAGIRAIQHKKRSLIVAIDNRANEISRDIGLNIVKRNDFEKIDSFINSEYVTDIKIPLDNINKWKNQFYNIKKSI